MASMWRRAMVYLGLQDDDELDYGGDYEPYGDYGDHHLDDAHGRRRRRARRRPGACPRTRAAGSGPGHGARRA